MFIVPVRVTVVLEITLRCFTVNVAVVFPAAIVTDTGTVAAVVVELLSDTTAPPVGAMPLIVTVPVTTLVELPWTVVGLTAKETKAAGCTVIVAGWLLAPRVAVIVALVVALTAFVVILNVAVEAFAATETDAGMDVDDVEDVVNFTVVAAFTAAFRVTDPVEPTPPITLVGLIVKPVT